MEFHWIDKFPVISSTDDTDDDDETEDDLDYNGSNSAGDSGSGTGTDSIVIKIESNNASSRKLVVNNLDTNKPLTTSATASEPARNERPINVVDSTTVESKIATGKTLPSTTTSNYNYNNENYYSKDDMSVYDDVNNNRLNLRSSTTNNNNGDSINIGRSNAYEQRNIYVANNILSDSNTNNDSVKTYIHIEVYKGNLDDATTTKPKDVKSINAFDVKATTKSVQFHLNNGTDGTAEMSTTKP